MDFEFTDEQVQLRDAIARWAQKSYPFERRRAIVAAGGYSPDGMRELADLGLAGLVIPPEHGGLGLGAVEAMVVMEELGRALVLEPYAAAALIAPALLLAADAPVRAEPWLARIAAGEALVAPALQERAARHRGACVWTRATPVGAEGWALQGRKSLVPAAPAADAFILPARVHGAHDDPAGIGLYLVERGAAGLGIAGHALQDGSLAGELTLSGTPAIRLCAPGPAHPALARAIDVGIAALAAEAVGAMEELLRSTAAYLGTRRQFGAPIGTFQALRHRIADMKMQLELARSMSYFATLKLGSPAPERRRALAQAKVQLGQSMRFVGQQAVQLHGGIGCTDELPASHYFKRLTCIELTFGDTLHHLEEVSRQLGAPSGVST